MIRVDRYEVKSESQWEKTKGVKKLNQPSKTFFLQVHSSTRTKEIQFELSNINFYSLRLFHLFPILTTLSIFGNFRFIFIQFIFVVCCSVTQSCPTLCIPMDYSTPGLPVPHHLPEFAQIHGISDALQLSHPLMPSSSAFNLSQHQEFFP